MLFSYDNLTLKCYNWDSVSTTLKNQVALFFARDKSQKETILKLIVKEGMLQYLKETENLYYQVYTSELKAV